MTVAEQRKQEPRQSDSRRTWLLGIFVWDVDPGNLPHDVEYSI